MSTIHIAGGGLAGLAAAVFASKEKARVVLYEAAGQAGGRCRSYADPTLECTIDNGNHLVLSGNPAVHEYLRLTGARDALAGPRHAEFAFADIATGARWTVRPDDGPLPWWIFDAARRVPDTTPLDYLSIGALLLAGKSRRIGEVMACRGPLWERLLRPLLLAALNTEPKDASAGLAGAVLRETLMKGGRAYAPRIAKPTLAAAFVEPALAFLAAQEGAMVHLGQRLRRIVFEDDLAVALEFPESTVNLAREDTVVLAVPPSVASDLVPGLKVPTEFRAIVNTHFKLAPPEGTPAMLGVIGGTAEWIFAFEDRISVTVSAADAIVDKDREALAWMLWDDVARALGIDTARPRWQIVKEKRATFAATPEQAARRPGCATRWRNLLLAGDWTDTGLPATIESALRSGQTAARLACGRTVT